MQVLSCTEMESSVIRQEVKDLCTMWAPTYGLLWRYRILEMYLNLKDHLIIVPKRSIPEVFEETFWSDFQPFDLNVADSWTADLPDLRQVIEATYSSTSSDQPSSSSR
jgi:hypothetical protein